MGYRIGIFGASGYVGGELTRLVDGHPDLAAEVLAGKTSAGAALGEIHPHLGGPERRLVDLDPAAAADLDLVFLAVPHGESAEIAVELLHRGIAVADLGSDFRLDSAARYQEAYGRPHPHVDQFGRWGYGVPELFRASIRDGDRTAIPGCYPTAAILALAPLLDAGLIEPAPIIVDAMSGVSGAGRAAQPHLTFGAVDESVAAYGVLTHRHRPEMEQALEMASGREPTVLFTPHLVPMQRGLLATCHAPASDGVSVGDVVDAFEQAYRQSPFVRLVESPPQTRWVVGSNRCLLSARFDPRTGTVLVLSALDNLMKGAAGQAIQCANLMLGLSEEAGLPIEGWMP